MYAERGAVAQLEQEVAELLGKPAAAMFPSGIMAQQAALRVWCDRAGSTRVGIPELSHLLQHEDDGPRLLHGFRFEHVSTGPQPPDRRGPRAGSGAAWPPYSWRCRCVTPAACSRSGTTWWR